MQQWFNSDDSLGNKWRLRDQLSSSWGCFFGKEDLSLGQEVSSHLSVGPLTEVGGPCEAPQLTLIYQWVIPEFLLISHSGCHFGKYVNPSGLLVLVFFLENLLYKYSCNKSLRKIM